MTESELAVLMKKYENLVWTVVSGILKNRRDREEVTADVFVSLWKSGFDDASPGAKSFVITVAKRRATDRLRLMRPDEFFGETEELSEILDADSGQVIDEEVIESLENEQIASVIRSLDPPDDEIFTRRYWYDQKVKTIAKELGLTPSFVKTRLERAKTGIRKKLVALGITR